VRAMARVLQPTHHPISLSFSLSLSLPLLLSARAAMKATITGHCTMPNSIIASRCACWSVGPGRCALPGAIGFHKCALHCTFCRRGRWAVFGVCMRACCRLTGISNLDLLERWSLDGYFECVVCAVLSAEHVPRTDRVCVRA